MGDLSLYKAITSSCALIARTSVSMIDGLYLNLEEDQGLRSMNNANSRRPRDRSASPFACLCTPNYDAGVPLLNLPQFPLL